MRNSLKILIAFGLLLASTSAAAEPVTVKKGERVPFDGTLMTNEDAATLVVKLESCQKEKDIKLREAEEKCQVEVDHVQAKADLESEYSDKEHEIELAAVKQQYEFLQKEFDRQMRPNLLKDPKFAFAMGMLTTGAIVALSGVVIHEVQEATK